MAHADCRFSSTGRPDGQTGAKRNASDDELRLTGIFSHDRERKANDERTVDSGMSVNVGSIKSANE